MDVLDLIETFVDGEPVNPSALKAALASAEARDHLIDILVLRGLVAEQTQGRRGAGASRSRPSAARWAPAAAVIALVGGITGYVVGTRSVPPPPSSTPVSSTSAAPTPTEVIHLQTGLGWTEHGGGD